MHKFRYLLEYAKGNLPEQEACELIGTSVRNLRQMKTLWGDRLKHIVPILDMLGEAKNTKEDQMTLKRKLQEITGASSREVNRMITRAGIKIPKPISRQTFMKKHEEEEFRRRRSWKNALDFVAGLTDAVHAAEAAEVTRKHIYDLSSRVLSGHGLRNIDLRRIPMDRRKEIADEFEKKLEKSKEYDSV